MSDVRDRLCGTCGRGYELPHADFCEDVKAANRISSVETLSSEGQALYARAALVWNLDAEVIRGSHILRRHLESTGRYKTNLPRYVADEIERLR